MSEPCPSCQGQGRVITVLRSGHQVFKQCTSCAGQGIVPSQENGAATLTRLLDAMGQRVFR